MGTDEGDNRQPPFEIMFIKKKKKNLYAFYTYLFGPVPQMRRNALEFGKIICTTPNTIVSEIYQTRTRDLG